MVPVQLFLDLESQKLSQFKICLEIAIKKKGRVDSQIGVTCNLTVDKSTWLSTKVDSKLQLVLSSSCLNINSCFMFLLR